VGEAGKSTRNIFCFVLILSYLLKQEGFEGIMAYGYPWQQWHVPICISYDGLFINEEIETGA
jgi:hypothetical protein